MNLYADSYDVKEYKTIHDYARQSPVVPIESKVPALPKSSRAQPIQHKQQHSDKANYNATF